MKDTLYYQPASRVECEYTPTTMYGGKESCRVFEPSKQGAHGLGPNVKTYHGPGCQKRAQALVERLNARFTLPAHPHIALRQD